MIAMADHVGGAGNASNRNDPRFFRAEVVDGDGDRRSLLLIGFDIDPLLRVQFDRSEHARSVAVDVVSFRRSP